MHPASLIHVSVIALATCSNVNADVAEPLLRNLPAGVSVLSSVAVSRNQTAAIGQKLGGQIQRLTNSVLSMHGSSVQVNVITAVDDRSAEAIHQALARIKPYPYCMRKGAIVVEFVGNQIDRPTVTKVAYEIGLIKKPDSVRYRVVAEMAAVDEADYMSANRLFNHFLQLQDKPNEQLEKKINELTAKFKFGSTLSLRRQLSPDQSVKLQFAPVPEKEETGNTTVTYSFGELPERQGVPFVTATIDVEVDATGFSQANAPGEQLTTATSFWPSDDPRVRALSKRITAGASSRDDKAAAILGWLTPGRNLKYAGSMGTRWGTLQTLEQKFGRCWDFSDCFVTLARAAGIPSRQVAGWLYGSGGHVWAEYYSEQGGWQQVDPTGGGKLPCGIYHIPYLASENGRMPIVYLSKPTIEVLP